MTSKSDLFVNGSVIGFGFIGGLISRIVVDPEGLIIESLLEAIGILNPSFQPFISLILLLIALGVMPTSILLAFSKGRILGLISVALSWLGGFLFIGGDIQTYSGITLVILAIILGTFAFRKSRLHSTVNFEL
jgi:uncharacterized membrane protein